MNDLERDERTIRNEERLRQDDIDEMRAEQEWRRRKYGRRGWGIDERTGKMDYCPWDPQRQVDEPENEEETDDE